MMGRYSSGGHGFNEAVSPKIDSQKQSTMIFRQMINSMASRYSAKHQGERAINTDLPHCTLFPCPGGVL
ncbi:P-loop containing nucleoside triphosphate hydrolases superfamily protein [Prunus dulcis]|uniref:P-loop containing nucleoside triphosphate hydrolases superfamily protein n=1 Tax=Prunus dulcis TaxID=3755 RepID=A0A4Y1RNN0_PRUDU|nr:P-loop containing nucleoside triphosphate hydrolases superfamily protein [Prunus dulcis]